MKTPEWILANARNCLHSRILGFTKDDQPNYRYTRSIAANAPGDKDGPACKLIADGECNRQEPTPHSN